MKKLVHTFQFLVLALVAAFSTGSRVNASDIIPVISAAAQIEIMKANVESLDLINWKVGDNAKFNVAAGSFGNIGTLDKSVSKDEGTALWLTQQMNVMIQNQKVETLINKADGKVLKMIVNGKEQAIPDDKIEIISQDYTEITVPAGKFKAIHVVAKSTQSPKIEVWANPRDTVMEGTLKQTMNTQNMDIAIELTGFKRAP